MAEQESLLKTARRRFKLASDYWEKQRIREKDDLRFQVPEYQWSDEARRQRQGGLEGTMVIPPRPMLSVSKIAQPLQLVKNQERQAKLGIEIHPLSPDADDEVAEIQQGIYRQIERDSNARTVRSWAFGRAVDAGLGYYRVKTDWDPSVNPRLDEAARFDQVIMLERILYQDAIYWDPAAEQPDNSDAEYVFLARWLSRERFKVLYPDAKISKGMDDDGLDGWDWESMTRETPDWVRTDDTGEKAILVCEYFYKEHSREQLKGPGGKTRDLDMVTVSHCLCVANEVLEEGIWPGQYIPIITVIGQELQPFDNERRWVGMIGPNKDSQRAYNYAISQAVESAALEPKAPFMGTKEQFEGLESWYQQANIRNWPYLPYNAHVVNGSPLPPPARVQADSSKLQLSMALASQMNSDLQAGTFEFDPGLGQRSNRQESGVAIRRLQEQGDLANASYLHNLADISMHYEARVVLDIMPKVYDRPGRLVRTLGTEDDTEAVILNQPFIFDPSSEQPIPLPPQFMEPDGNFPPSIPGPQGEQIQVKYYDLSKGAYRVSVSVAPSSETQAQQAAEEIGAIWESNPQMAPLIAPIYMQYRNFPGAKEMAKVLRVARDIQFPQIAQAEEQDKLSKDQLMAQLQAAQAQLKQAQDQLQQAGQVIQGEQVKQQGNMAKAQLDASVKMQIAQLQAEVDLLKERMRTDSEANRAVLDADEAAKDRTNELAKIATKAALAPAPMEKYNPNYRGPLKKPLGSDESV